MTQEEKSLLLKDLCARVPYGVILNVDVLNIDCLLCAVYQNKEHPDCVGIGDNGIASIECVKPYLRPMSSMTEEEKKEYDSFLFDNLERENVIGYEDKAFGIDVIMRYRSWQVVQWLLKHHLDFNGLIDVYGLALEAPKDMYK